MAQSVADQISSATNIPPVSSSDLGGGGIDQYLSQMAKNDTTMREEMKPVIEDLKSQKSPSPPVLQEVPKDASQVKSPMENFGSAAMWMATLGSLFTKQPFMNSLAATTGALNAAHQNDIETFNRQMEQLKVHNENAQKAADFEMETYKNAIDKDKSLSSAYTSMFKNDTAAQLASIKMQDEYMKNFIAQMKNARDNSPFDMWKSHMDAWDQAHPDAPKDARDKENMKSFLELTNKGYAAAELKGGGVLTDDQFKTMKDSPEVIAGADAMHQGLLPSQAMPGFSANNPTRLAAMRLAREKWPDDNLAVQHLKYIGRTAEARTLETRAIQTKYASNILDSSIPSAIQAAEKVGLTPSTDLNGMINAIKAHANDPDYKNLQTQIRALATDYAQFLGRGRQTVHSDEEALKILNTNMDVGSLTGFKNAVATEQTNIKKGIKETEDDVFGDQNNLGSSAADSTKPSQPTGGASHKWNPSTGKLEEIP